MPAGGERTIEFLFGEQRLLAHSCEIRALRVRCGQQDDVMTDPAYVVAINSLNTRRVAAVLFRRENTLEACVFFYEHCRLGLGLGLLRGGNIAGEGLAVGPADRHLEYTHLAAQALLQHWRIHGISLAVMTSLHECMRVMGTSSKYRLYYEKTTECQFALQASYHETLAQMGRHTRKSLAGKRRQLESEFDVQFVPVLQPAEALEAMLWLRSRAIPRHNSKFYHARHRLLSGDGSFFTMGLRLSNGPWLSMLSGWRLNKTTFVDLQMNDKTYKKQSLSAVLRAYMLEHEISQTQQFINFPGGTSLLLRRYCQPVAPSAFAFLWRPCLRANIARMIVPRLKSDSVYQHLASRSPAEDTGLKHPEALGS